VIQVPAKAAVAAVAAVVIAMVTEKHGVQVLGHLLLVVAVELVVNLKYQLLIIGVLTLWRC
jgi:hypothetical protein